MNGRTERMLRIPSIEYLRGLASISVAWFHLTNQYPYDWVRWSGNFGHLGVEVFFVISGCVVPLSLNYTAEVYTLKKFPRFLFRRIVRLEPPYILSVILSVVLWYLSSKAPNFHGQPPQSNPWQILSHILYIIPFTSYGWLQPVYWTLGVEFIFYLLIGVLFPLIATGHKESGAWLVFAPLMILVVIIGPLPYMGLLFVIGISVYRTLTAHEIRYISSPRQVDLP